MRSTSIRRRRRSRQSGWGPHIDRYEHDCGDQGGKAANDRIVHLSPDQALGRGDECQVSNICHGCAQIDASQGRLAGMKANGGRDPSEAWHVANLLEWPNALTHKAGLHIVRGWERSLITFSDSLHRSEGIPGQERNSLSSYIQKAVCARQKIEDVSSQEEPRIT